LAHAGIVFGAQDDDLAGLVAGAADAIAETAGDPLKIGKGAVAPLGMERRNRLGEIDRSSTAELGTARIEVSSSGRWPRQARRSSPCRSP